MQDNTFTISFTVDDRSYSGEVDHVSSPGQFPLSFHLDLNNGISGDLSFDNCDWTTAVPLPEPILKAAGKEIEKHYKL